MLLKIFINKFKKLFFRRHSDYSFNLYMLRVSSFLFTWLFYIASGFNSKRRINFHANLNPLYKRYLQNKNRSDKRLNLEFDKQFLRGESYNFNGIILPKVEDTTTLRFIYEDVLAIYTKENDNYHYSVVHEYEKKSTEGPFCYVSKKNEKIIIEEGDVVIDAGAWIGDFSAYCAKKKAFVYAFEPTSSTIKYLRKTIELNKAEDYINIVPMGLSDKTEIKRFNDFDTGSANSVDDNGNIEIQTTTLDDWAKEVSIPKIDFIKADIEGFERKLINGARWILKTHEPILSICTYHLSDDPFVLEKLIKKINPKYKIIQRKMKLYAYVPK
jgi:FkbM family methyltransferase